MSAATSVFKLIAVFGLVLMLSGCIQWLSRGEVIWSQDLPPRAHFEALYADDAVNQQLQTETEYLRWVKRFYQGWHLYGKGWNDFAPEVLAEVEDPEQRVALERDIMQLGKRIVGEWAKDSGHTRITTRHLSIWGNALREAMAQGEERKMLEQLAQDVDNLLERRLADSDITAGRYYVEDENDVFR